MDGLLRWLYRTAEDHGAPAPLLGAVGGYGRAMLGYGSDIDVRFLVEDEPEEASSFVEALLYPLWDAGVRTGHQVITVEDALEMSATDLPTATALLDWRSIAGDAELGRLLEAKAYDTLFHEAFGLPAFLDRLEEGARRRHERFGDSVYLLEPNVKSGAGGLRDLDVALWAGRARFRASGIDGLEEAGVILPREARALRRAQDFLWCVRNKLHQQSRRQNDRLGFDQQESIAEWLGYRERIGAAPHATTVQVAGTMTEAFMSDYYRHARVVERALGQLLTRSRPRITSRPPSVEPLGRGICTIDGLVGFDERVDLDADPAATLRLYVAAARRDLPVRPEARDRILRAVASEPFAEALRSQPEAAVLFVRLVCTVQEARFKNGSVLGELHDVGLLTAMIPEFVPVVGRVHHDVYHVYTVDVHSVAAVDRLRELVRGDLSRTHPLACRLAAEVARPEVLFMATLLHDVGKAIGGRDHATRGADMAQSILRRLDFRPEDIDEVCHLVRQHLLMYLVAVRRDFHEPATLSEFVALMHGAEGLRELYLMTIADVSTTSPTAMNRWKAGMLEELYLTANGALNGDRPSTSARLARVREQTRRLWTDDDEGFIGEYLESMPERYLLSSAPEDIVAHARLARASEDAPVGAALVPSRHADVAELCVVAGGSREGTGLCVVTHDRPGLLASIAAVLSARGLEIHAAEVHSRHSSDGRVQAVDLFWIRCDGAGREAVERILPALREDLRKVVLGEMDPDDILVPRSGSRWSARPSPTVPSEVVIDHRASSAHTVVEVLTKDRPGMLFALAQCLHRLGLVISVAKINTEGTRVADVFYVTEADGSKVTGAERVEAIYQRLHETLAEMNESASSGDDERSKLG